MSAPTTDRWWAPTRATTSPDAVVLALCEPGDLGSALLAAHRAGAAAIDTLTVHPLPDESVLVDALVSARSAFAVPVHGAIAKSMETHYADLLLRDWLDEAEQGALALFRTAVTKGVSPQVAAVRTSSIFGVPATAMGSYFAKAIDPRTPAPALAQEADRLLMAHVAALVESEADQSLVAIAKATEEAFQEANVVRDADGRFAKEPGTATATGGGGARVGSNEWLRAQLAGTAGGPARVGDMVRQAQERVAAEDQQTKEREAEPVAPTIAKPARRQQRKQRVQRTQRTAPAPELARAGTLERNATLTRRMDPAALKRATLARSQQLDRQMDLTVRAKTRGAALPDDVMKPFPVQDDGQYTESPEKFTVVVTDSTAALFRNAVAKLSKGGPGLFRFGHLADENTEVVSSRGNEALVARGNVSRQAENDSVRRAAEDETAPAFERPNMVTQAVRDSTFPTDMSFDHYAQQQLDLAIDKVSTEMRANESAHFVMESDYEDPSKKVIVHYPGDGPNRAHPAVHEFVIDGQANVRAGGTHSKPDLEFDPNQVYLFKPASTEKFIDISHQDANGDVEPILVVRWHIEPIDDPEGIVKAADSQFQEVDVVRDAEGKFARQGSVTADINAQLRAHRASEQQKQDEQPLVREQAPNRVRRTQRTQRVQRTQRTAPSLVRSATPLTRSSELTRSAAMSRSAGLARSPLHRSLQQAFAQRSLDLAVRSDDGSDGLPLLADHLDYKVFDGTSWDEIAFELNQSAGWDPQRLGDSIRLSPAMASSMLAGTPLNAHEIEYALTDNIDHAESDSWIRRPLMSARTDDVIDDAGEFVDRTKQLFNNPANANMQRMSIETDIFNPDVIHVFGHFGRAKTQAVIQLAEDYNPKEPGYLTYIGQYNAQRLGTFNHADAVEAMKHRKQPPLPRPVVTGVDLGTEGHVPNPAVKIYRLSSRRFEMGN